MDSFVLFLRRTNDSVLVNVSSTSVMTNDSVLVNVSNTSVMIIPALHHLSMRGIGNSGISIGKMRRVRSRIIGIPSALSKKILRLYLLGLQIHRGRGRCAQFLWCVNYRVTPFQR